MTSAVGTLSDADLAERVLKGPPHGGDAEAELCRRFLPRLRAYGRRHLRDRDAADELVQRVLVLVIDKLRAGEVRNLQSIASFVLGSAHHVVYAMRRSEVRLRPLSESSELSYEPRPPLDSQRLGDCLQRLGDRDRTVVALTFFDEMSAPEVAGVIGTSSGNVRVMRHRALAALRDCIDGRPS